MVIINKDENCLIKSNNEEEKLKVRIHLHNQKYRSKPKKSEIGKISNEITDKIREIDIERFAQEVGKKGRIFTTSIFNGRRAKENFVSQQVFCLDFDKGFTLDEFKERAKQYDIHPSMIYNTFSNTKESPRFRVVFINDCEIQNEEAAFVLMYMLLEIFPESDKSCKDITRMFFGGNDLKFVDSNATINLVDISLSLQAYLKSRDKKNYRRKIEQIGRKMQVQVNNGKLRIRAEVLSDVKSEELLAMTSNMIRVNATESSLFYVIEKESHNHSMCRRQNREKKQKKVRGISEKILLKKCPLFKDFYEKNITHEQKFLIATNLLSISGGENLFFAGNINHVEKWKENWEYLKQYHYVPQHCKNGNCHYYEKCRSPTILDKVTEKISKNRIEGYCEIGEAEKILRSYLLQAVQAKEKGIYLISAQTALGKTSTYCNIVKENYQKKPFMVVVPTTKLQREVGEELERLNVPVFMTENIYYLLSEIHLDDLKGMVMYLYKMGFGYKVKSVIRAYMSNSKLDVIQERRLREYLKSKERLEDSRCVVTTHAMFLSFQSEIINRYEVVIDEDILMSIFKNTSTISFGDIELALEKEAIPEEERSFVKRLLNASDSRIEVRKPLELRISQLDKIYEKEILRNVPLVDFLQAASYQVDVPKKQVNFFNVRQIPDVKMTIVSATLNEELYKNYCKGQKICFMKVPVVKYKGKLIQYTAHSLSRSNLADIGYEKIKEKLDKFIESKEKNIITFKKYREDSEIYYGKSEGYNEYKGKDLIVIGTPHNVPFLYHLIGAYLGYDAEDKLCLRMTENDTYSFKFMTFKDDKMRNLQFYFIESELEQAIGRARLLRYDCRVYLFSNYPCRQADIIEDEYLDLA